MKAIRFLALLAMAAMFSVSFNSCNLIDDDDPVNGLEDIDECTWAELKQKAKFISAFPELEGKFTNVILSSNVSDGYGHTMDAVQFFNEIEKQQRDSYVQKLTDNKFYVSIVGDYIYGYKVEDDYNHSFTIMDDMFHFQSYKYADAEEYQTDLEEYQADLKSMGITNVTWSEVLKDNEWLKEFPEPTGSFSQCKITEEGVTLIDDFSEEYLTAYKELLKNAGFKEVGDYGLYFQKDIDGYRYFVAVVTMDDESGYINYEKYEI